MPDLGVNLRFLSITGMSGLRQLWTRMDDFLTGWSGGLSLVETGDDHNWTFAIRCRNDRT